jgi:hypothetical protein
LLRFCNPSSATLFGIPPLLNEIRALRSTKQRRRPDHTWSIWKKFVFIPPQVETVSFGAHFPPISQVSSRSPQNRSWMATIDCPIHQTTSCADRDFKFLYASALTLGRFKQSASAQAYQLACYNVSSSDTTDSCSRRCGSLAHQVHHWTKRRRFPRNGPAPQRPRF